MADCPVNHTGLCVDGWAGNCTATRCKLEASVSCPVPSAEVQPAETVDVRPEL